MRRTFALLLLLLPLAATAQEPTRPAKKIDLFDGLNLKGLVTWLRDTKDQDPRQVFKVENGILHISGDGFGYIRTKERYRDYKVTVEYRWGQRTDGGKHVRNSGILLHATGPDGGANGTWMSSIECQLAQGCVGDLITIRGKDGLGDTIPVELTSDVVLGPDKRPRWKEGGEKRIFTKGQLWWNRHDPTFKELLDTRGKDDVESQLGDWTRVECRCAGKTIDVFVNDKHINHAYDVSPAFGHILLQSEGFELYVRRFELTPID